MQCTWRNHRQPAVHGTGFAATIRYAGSLVFCAVASFGLPGCRGQKPPEALAAAQIPLIEVTTAPVERKRIASSLELTGNLIPRRRAVIVSELDAIIEAIPRPPDSVEMTAEQRQTLASLGIDLNDDAMSLDVGDEVPKGAVLVRLVKRDFELDLVAAKARLLKAENDLQDLRAWKRPEEVRRLKAVQDAAKAKLEQARSEFQRAERLRQQSALSASEHEEQRMVFETAQATLDQATAELDIAQAGPTPQELAVAEATVAQAQADVAIAQERLEKTVIHAPYDAVVTDRYVDVGERVTAMPRVEIMEIVDMQLVLAQVGVPERYISNLQFGERVLVRAEGITTPVPGHVVVINDKVDKATRTFRVKIAVDNRNRKLKVGQFVRVQLDFASAANTLTVPTAALTFLGGRPQVFLFRDDRVTLRPIQPGIANDELTEILSGLEEGDQVVVHDPSILADGMKVRRQASVAQSQPEPDGSAVAALAAGPATQSHSSPKDD